MTTYTTLTIPAAQYADADDCLAACAADIAVEYDCEGYDMAPRWADDDRDAILVDVPRSATEDEAGTPSLTEALAWAETAQPGEYLVRYADTGLTDAEDPGSRCGYDDSDLSMIRSTLAERSLTLAADDLGLLAAERSEEV